MRAGTDRPKLLAFIDEIGKAAQGPGRVYLVGGSTALLLGIRDQTVDIDVKLDPEPEGIFESIANLKESLAVNVELASPDHFIPPIPGWQDRSEFIVRGGLVDFFHYDFYSQALAKILRGHQTDLSDARAFVRLGKVETARLKDFFDEIRAGLVRFPAINSQDFQNRVERFIEEVSRETN